VPKNLQRDFGRRIRELRDKSGWTQRQLSERAKLSYQHVNNIENGHREPCLEALFKLAAAFDIKASQLIEDLD
jgi:transcriptional regulator with XRE-family HTH domain